MIDETRALTVESVTASYGPIRALDAISMYVSSGEIVAVLGSNGAGKTTLLRAISGVIRAEGELLFHGTSLRRRSPEKIVPLGIAHVPQGRGTFPTLTVEENLRVGATRRRDREISADIEHWYSTFPRLGERRAQRAGGLSGGEQQMLALARAMMSRPQMLLLDEPSLGLAPNVSRDLMETLAVLNQENNTTVLLVEQNARMALAIAHRAYVLEAGRVVLDGPASDLADDDSVRRAYLGI